MNALVVLVGCEYDENLGLIARAMKNFGLSELLLVKPKADKDSDKAKSRAMHALDVLRKASIHASLESALKKADFSIATTGIASKSTGKGRKALTPKKLAEKFCHTDAKLAIVFGRESNGLTNNEIEKCDFIVSIPASTEYPILNISHACTVIFYELFKAKSKSLFKTATRNTKNAAIKKFEELALANQRIKNKKAVMNSFKHVIARAPATEKELKAITGVLSESLKKIKKESQHQ